MHDPQLCLAAVAVCAALAIWGHRPQRMPIHWGFKPLPAVLLLLGVLSLAPIGPVRTLVAVALVSSLLGDVFLMLPQRWLVLGLASFLIALVCYTVAFSLEVTLVVWHLPLLLAPLLPAVWVTLRLWPYLRPGLKPPVLVYVGAMTLLVWRLLVRLDGSLGTAVALAGGVAFMVADSLLALRRFAGWRVPYALELGPYFAAQACLAASTWM